MRQYRGTLSFVVALVLLFTTMVGSATDRVSEAGESLIVPPAVESATDGVKAALLSGDARRARALYNKSILSDSTYAPAHYALATLMLQNRADSAVLHARKAYEIDTTNRWYLSTYAQSLVGVGRLDEAGEYYERLIKLNPRDINAYRILAIIYSRSERTQEAIAILDTAELRVGRNEFLTQLKQQMLISTNQVDRAIAEAQSVVAEAPYSAESRVSMAELYAAIKNDSMAMLEFGVAMRIDSTRLETQLIYGDYLRRTGRGAEYVGIIKMVLQSEDLDIEDKRALVAEIIKDKVLFQREYERIGSLISDLQHLAPSDPVFVEMQTQYLISGGKVEQASEFLKSHIVGEEAISEQYKMVASIEHHLNRPDSVERYLRLGLERFPDESGLRYELAYMLTSQRRYEAAIECYETELRIVADSLKSSVVGIIGDLYQQISVEAQSRGDRGAEKRALKMSYKRYEEALKYDADNALVLNNYAYFISERGGNLEKALAMSVRSNELVASNPTFLDTHAWVLYRMGRYDEAKVVMRQAISFDMTENSEIALHYGEILSVLGEDTMANFYWDKAISWGMSEEAVAQSRERAREAVNRKNIENNDRKR